MPINRNQCQSRIRITNSPGGRVYQCEREPHPDIRHRNGQYMEWTDLHRWVIHPATCSLGPKS